MAIHNGAASFSGLATFTAVALYIVMDSSASISVIPYFTKEASASLVGLGTLVPAAQVISPCTISLLSSAIIIASSASELAGSMSLESIADVEVIPQRIQYSSVSITASSEFGALSNALLFDALLSDTRQIRPLLKVYFDTGVATDFSYNEILNVDLIEEYHNTNHDYLAVGGISLLELEVVLDNTNHNFDLDKTTSPYYGKLTPEKKVELVMQVFVDGNWEDVIMGTYYVAYWDDNDLGQVTLVAYDQLYFRGNQTVPEVPVILNISLMSLFEYILDMTSMTYSIDSRLNINIPFGTIPIGTIKDSLEYLALAGCCNVIVTKDDEIKVVLVEGNPTGSLELTGNDCIIAANTPTMINNIYSSTNIKKTTASIITNKEILTLANLEIPTGTSSLDNQTFMASPVLKVSQIKTSNDEVISVRVKRISAWSIDLEFTNSGATQIVDVNILGSMLNYSYQNNEIAVTTPVITDKPYDLEHELLQNNTLIANLESLIGDWVGDSKRKIVLESRGHPSIELGCALTITEARQLINNIKTYVARHNFIYDGGTKSKVECIRIGG